MTAENPSADLPGLIACIVHEYVRLSACSPAVPHETKTQLVIVRSNVQGYNVMATVYGPVIYAATFALGLKSKVALQPNKP